MSHYREIADLMNAQNPAEQLRQQRRILNEVYGSPYDRVQAAAARRQQGGVLDLPPIDLLAGHIAAHAARMGGERAAYAYLDDLTRAVNNELRRTKKGT